VRNSKVSEDSAEYSSDGFTADVLYTTPKPNNMLNENIDEYLEQALIARGSCKLTTDEIENSRLFDL